MFGRDHAGVGNYYGTYAAHEIFDQLPDLGIKSVLTLEWWYCPVCENVAYEGLCGHREHKQDLSRHFYQEHYPGRHRAGIGKLKRGSPGSGAGVCRDLRVRLPVRHRRLPGKPDSRNVPGGGGLGL